MLPSTRIYLCLGSYLLALFLAVFLPKMAAGDASGFAAAGTAAVTFIAFSLVAFGLAVALWVMTLRRRATLSPMARAVGLLPLPLTLIAAAIFYFALREQAEGEDTLPPPGEATAPAAPL